ncbi:hypothetical protein FHG87_001861 [Trinorchestia longiramus]|nr:hypothetical protein FHG87_001861 [Trinorchestia longiramus]
MIEKDNILNSSEEVITNVDNLIFVNKVCSTSEKAEFNFYKMKKDLWNSFCSLRHLTSYMGKISIIFISLLMFTFLVTIVYATLMEFLDTGRKLQFIAHLLICVFPIIFLVNLPTALVKNVAELKWMLTRLTIESSLKKHREQIMELKSLLDECPTFEMNHVFTLSRSKIVNIVSFVATYVVIFMQFALSEDSTENSCCNCTVTVQG